jgi:hypothetical protein
MMLALAAALLVGGPDSTVYHGRLGDLSVRPPRIESEMVVDGVLDEPAWARAAILTGFSQYSPVDRVAATDSTEVLIWYSPTALHLGVRAWDSAGAVRATLAERDRIGNDDQVQFFLSTFNDGRQATFLAVNPLGVQADGALNESGRTSCGGFNCAVSTREAPDLSQDFVWESKGRLVPGGYEVEIRIPFKSIRFQTGESQAWGINILRVVQRSGQEQTWTPVARAASSFLAQSGQLTGLEALRRGTVVDLIPTLTSVVRGGGTGSAGRWTYDGGAPEIGGTARWGITPNLTMNATANPDFSQVESDAGQFAFDPRQALFFAERRPFFLDGLEQFDAPNRLIYTRRIVQPVVATKLAGRAMGTQLGVLAAVDDRIASRHGDNPLFGVMRLTRDLGPGSRLGAVWTEQADGPDRNRVVGIDGRLVLGGIHSFTFDGAIARDVVAGEATTAPIWSAGYALNGRTFRARYSVSGIASDFRTRSGFISRPGIARANIAHSLTRLREGEALEALTGEIVLDGTWQYDDFVAGRGIQDEKLHFNVNTRWRGGWRAGVSWLEETFGYDPSIYRDYAVQGPDGEVLPFVGTPRLPNRDYLITIGSPAFALGQFNLFYLWGRDENFFEWASGDIQWITASMTLRPSEQARLVMSYNHQQVNRPADGSRVSLQIVPRAQLEYQISRAMQVRIISQYALSIQDSLRDNSRTELPILVRNPSTGAYERDLGGRDGRLRTDLLFTYLPNPGTVVYLGYGASHQEPDELGRREFTRTDDGVFVKMSYLFRVQ